MQWNLLPIRLTNSFFHADTVQSFVGNHTHNDHFKLLQSDGDSLLIGARNVVYNLSIADLEENREQVRTSTNFINCASDNFLMVGKRFN